MSKKFELIKNDSIEIDDHKLYRIRALINFSDVKAGDLGGYVENENNLSQMNACWIYDNACVYGNASVYDSACVCDDACVFGNARIFDNACVYDSAYVADNACVCGNARIFDNACVCYSAWISGNACVCDDACVCGNAYISDNAHVSGNATVFNNANIGGDAIIKSDDDYIVFKNTWSSRRYFTYTKSNKMWRVGCFYGSGDELIQKAYADSENNGKNYELYVNLVKEMENLEKEQQHG